jgi:hypothetical protein
LGDVDQNPCYDGYVVGNRVGDIYLDFVDDGCAVVHVDNLDDHLVDSGDVDGPDGHIVVDPDAHTVVDDPYAHIVDDPDDHIVDPGAHTVVDDPDAHIVVDSSYAHAVVDPDGHIAVDHYYFVFGSNLVAFDCNVN